GDVLELLHTSPERWSYLRLAGTEWRHDTRLNQAFMGWTEAQRASVGISFVQATSDDEVVSEETIQQWRLWRAKPDKIRTQFLVGAEMVTAVLRDYEWWSWTASGGLRTNGGDPSSQHGHGPGDVLVETPRLISSLKLRAVQRATFLSRS